MPNQLDSVTAFAFPEFSRGSSNPNQSGSEQKHTGWLGNGGLLRTSYHSRNRCGLTGIDCQVINAKKERAHAACSRPAFAIRVIEREKDGRVVEVNLYSAISRTADRAD